MASIEADPSPAAVAAVADAMAQPGIDVEKVLSDHGWTAAAFEARLYDVAADPALTEAYLDAR